MNYEQMYKEALERAKNGKPIDEVFPELKESEDERIRKEITELVMCPTWKTEAEFYRRKELVAWLEKQCEQKPAWSEEDCDTIETIATHLVNTNNEGMANALWEIEDKLKSMKPQPHWKPNDEQMSALRHCCDGWQDNADGRLESLYNDLKKLKEE